MSLLCVFASLRYNRCIFESKISKLIVDAAIEVYRQLGGRALIQDLYEKALAEALRFRGSALI
jgi:hypothetical protein